MFVRSAMLACALLASAVPQDVRAQTSPLAPELLRPNLVDIGGGRRLNLHCQGSGSPTIVFEQGGEGFLTNWKKVQPTVAKLTRTCVYDRAGFGYSDPPDKPVTGLNVTDDLHALLRRAKVSGPLVLVGHSIGGFYATLYADRFPQDVVGLVLLDPAHVGQEAMLPPEQHQRHQANGRRGESRLLHCAELARTGELTRNNLDQNGCVPLWPGSTPDEAPYLLHAILRPHWHLAEHSQSVHFFPGDAGPSVSWRQAMQAKRSFGAMPVHVLSGANYSGNAWRSAEELQQDAEHWRAGHRQLAARSTNGRWLLVPGAGHFIQTDQPDAVIKAIREVVTAARRSGADARPR